MLSKRQIKELKKIPAKYGLDSDTVDTAALIDHIGLNFEENKEILEAHCVVIGTPPQPSKAEVERQDAENTAIGHVRAREAAEALKTSILGGGENANLLELPMFYQSNHYTRMAARGISNGAIIKGERGTMKSHAVMWILNAEGVEYVHKTGYMTPLTLYGLLYENREGGLIVLDDVEGILGNESCMGFLKGALGELNGKRMVEYDSTSGRLGDLPNAFVFTGQIIFITNKFRGSDAHLLALKDRVNYVTIKPTYTEMCKITKALSENPHPNPKYNEITADERSMIADWIIKTAKPETRDFTARTLQKAYDSYLYSKKSWKKIMEKELEVDEKKTLLRELLESGMTVKQQTQKWVEAGHSRSHYYNLKKTL